MVRDRVGRAACHRLLEHPQAPLCLGSPTAPSHPTSSRYRSNTKFHTHLADAPLSLPCTMTATPSGPASLMATMQRRNDFMLTSAAYVRPPAVIRNVALATPFGVGIAATAAGSRMALTFRNLVSMAVF